MYPSNIVLWCYVLLLVSLSSDTLENSTNNDEQKNDSTMRYDLLVNSKNQDDKMLILYNLLANSTMNNEMQYEPHSMINDRKDSLRYESHGYMKFYEENNRMSTESRPSSIRVNGEDDFMLQALNESLAKTGKSNSISYEYGNSNRDNYNDSITIVSYEMCGNDTCIQLCCPVGDRLTSDGKCVAGQDNYSFPNIQNDSEKKKLDELFRLTVRDPCVSQGTAHSILNPDEYLFLGNGSLHRDSAEVVPSMSYCLAILDQNIYEAIVCMYPIGFPIYISVCLLVSLPFLLLTFIVYSILPEVQNVHTCTLRVHVASLFITNVVIFCVQEIPVLSERKYCIPLAYVFNITMLSSCFWLNATCFDIWWTFRKLDLLHKSIKNKRKKFTMYSIYAWGLTFSFTIACAIIDNVPGIPKDLIRPDMCKKKFWFGREDALTVYYYAPTGAAFISNVCFFVFTALAILYHNKHTAHELRGSESRRYDRKKRKFGTYLKLFIVMGLSWSMGVVLWLINASDAIPKIVWHVSYTIDILQGVIIFIIYVCKKKILRQLLKRFGYHDHDPFWTMSMNNRGTRTSSTLSYVSSISGSVPMQKINSPISQQTNPDVEPNPT